MSRRLLILLAWSLAASTAWGQGVPGDPLAADRPGATDPPTVVSPGTVQLEELVSIGLELVWACELAVRGEVRDNFDSLSWSFQQIDYGIEVIWKAADETCGNRHTDVSQELHFLRLLKVDQGLRKHRTKYDK